MKNNVTKLKPNKDVCKTTIKLWNLSSDIDALVEKAVEDELSPTDIAGVLANRLKEACLAASKATGKDVLSLIKDRVL